MPKQTITLEVYYDPINNDGDARPDPIHWPWESIADAYDEEDGRPYYTRTIKKITQSRVEALETDSQAIINWHEENCEPGDCRSEVKLADGECFYRDEEEEEEEEPETVDVVVKVGGQFRVDPLLAQKLRELDGQ